MIFEDAGGDAENKALTELFHLLYASEHRPTEADLRFSAANRSYRQPTATAFFYEFCSFRKL